MSPVAAGGVAHNRWHKALENCIEGGNYLRASEYRQLIELTDHYYQLQSDLTAAHAEADRLRELLGNLCGKIRASEPESTAIFSFAQIHGVTFNGEGFGDELEAAEAAIHAAKTEQETKP